MRWCNVLCPIYHYYLIYGFFISEIDKLWHFVIDITDKKCDLDCQLWIIKHVIHINNSHFQENSCQECTGNHNQNKDFKLNFKLQAILHLIWVNIYYGFINICWTSISVDFIVQSIQNIKCSWKYEIWLHIVLIGPFLMNLPSPWLCKFY